MNLKAYFSIKTEQIEYIYKAMEIAIYSIIVLTFIIQVTFEGIVDSASLTVWVSVNFSIAFFIILLGVIKRSYGMTLVNRVFYYRIFFLLVVLSGMAWGSSVFFIFPKQTEFQILLLLLTGGILSGAAVSMVARLEIFYSYLFLMITPFIYIFSILDSQISTAVFVSLLFYVAILVVISKKSFDTINDNIDLSDDNRALVVDLEERIDEVNRINEAKSKFLSIVSHEIRTPLNAIIGFITILKDSEKDSTKLNYLEIVDKSSYLLLNVLNDVLDITKIESGKFTLEKLAFNPTKEFRQLYELFEHESKSKGVHLLNCISQELPETISTDKLRLKQIISNLLSNAVKFTHEGKNIEFIVSFDKSRSLLYIEVKDEGIGISESGLDKVLEEFTQADDSTARKYGGTGLGLSISSKLLILLGSKLNIESQLHKGSRFSFEIEVDVIEDTKIDDIADTLITFNGEKILVAEDNKTNQMLIDLLLHEMNLDVTMANDGVEAEELFKQEGFTLVLMDINMPNKNGIEAMHTIKKIKPEIPVVAVTANSVAGDREKYLEEGFDDYLSKPIDNSALNRVIQKYLH